MNQWASPTIAPLDEEGPDEVSRIDEHLVACQREQADAAAEQAHQHEVVAGKQLRSGNHHQEQGHRKPKTHKQPGGSDAKLRPRSYRACQRAAQPYGGPCHHRQRQRGDYPGPGLCYPRLLNAPGDLYRRQRLGGGLRLLLTAHPEALLSRF